MTVPAPPFLEQVLIITPALQGPTGPTLANYPDWTIVSGLGPYQANPATPAIAFDGTEGPGLIEFWAPQPGDIIVIRDFKCLSAAGSVISVQASLGWTLENPSRPGTYATAGWIADPNGTAARWKASSLLSTWILW